MGRKNRISARYLDPVHSIWTKFGMDMLLDPTNKPAQVTKSFYDHSNYFKIPNGRHLGQNWRFETKNLINFQMPYNARSCLFEVIFN